MESFGTPAAGPPPGEVSNATPSAQRAAIILTNNDAVARNYILFEAELAAVVDPNLDPANSDQWIRLDPGEAIEVALESIPGWTPDATAVLVYTWTESVGHPVNGGTQWGGQGWYTMRVEL